MALMSVHAERTFECFNVVSVTMLESRGAFAYLMKTF